MMKLFMVLPMILVTALFITSCKVEKKQLTTSLRLVTSEEGDKLAKRDNVEFTSGQVSKGNILKINTNELKQEMDGIGSSFTESSAFVLAHLDVELRKEVMENIFGEKGANFSLTRTHIGSCDFSVEGKYSYLDKVGDTEMESFTLEPDKRGFDTDKYQGVKAPDYDLLPMIKEAMAIKKNQKDDELRIVASAWTAPYWMKDIEEWFIKGTPENNHQGTGGMLKPEYEELYADYLVKYLEEYKKEGVDVWSLTPVNEPHGNNGQWESMHFTPESQNEFVKKYLGPKLHNSRFKDVKLLVYDQNRDGLEHWTDVILGDEETAKYVYGTAVHWYESTFKVYEDVFERVNAKFPDKAIIHTEGCIDDLGKDAPGGITDPERFKEKDWFDNDSFWWNDNATDWGYSATWQGLKVEDHPIYTPVHRYARNIIVSIDHWLKGWIDWNVVLDKNGGPNHVGNFCGAPIMIDTETQNVYYTPIYHVLAQFSKTIRPGDRAVKTEKIIDGLGSDDLHACATLSKDGVLSIQLLNTTKEEIELNLQVDEQYAPVKMKANSVETIQIQL
ncbi:MAG: glycosyl hydrolase [Melioribacteraceae bacterium]|nr:MAG: glycosyl hydrolase [Melioribacteraceae bacterium]